MKTNQIRSTQTKVKHEILEKYLDTWGGIIINGLLGNSINLPIKLVYVDCFSFTGTYKGDLDNTVSGTPCKEQVYGSPIIGIKALDKLRSYAIGRGLNVTTNVILIERDAGFYKQLKTTLTQNGFDGRIRETSDFKSLLNGEIATVNEDALNVSNQLTAFTNNKSTWSFYLLDPEGPSGIPYGFTKKIVECDHHDVMINFMVEDLIRKSGNLLNPKIDATLKKLVDHWKNTYHPDIWESFVVKVVKELEDNRRWRDFLNDVPLDDMDDIELLTNKESAEKRETELIKYYKASLQKMDAKILIKTIPLQFPSKNRSMFYLFLTTHNSTGALTLNKILDAARRSERQLKVRYDIIRKFPCGQLSLLNPGEYIQEDSYLTRPPIEEIEAEILSCFRGKKALRKEVYDELTDTPYYPEEIDKALRKLRKKEKVSFDGNLKNKTQLYFSKLQN